MTRVRRQCDRRGVTPPPSASSRCLVWDVGRPGCRHDVGHGGQNWVRRASRAYSRRRADAEALRRHQRLPADRPPRLRVADRPDPNEDRHELNYAYRGGWDDRTSRSKTSDATVIDLSKFDAKAVVGVLRGAPATLSMKPTDVKSNYLSFDPSRDPTTPGALSIDVNVSSQSMSTCPATTVAATSSWPATAPSSSSTTPADVGRSSAVRNPLAASNISARYYGPRCRNVVAAKRRR